MKKRPVIAVVAVVLIGMLGLGYYHVMGNQLETVCGFCHRPIHPHGRVIAEVGGHRRAVCCARCAITESLQEKKPVRLIEVTDYVSGNALKPDHAYFVEGSRKAMCDHDASVLDETKHADSISFDRCAPGAYAFASREDAVTFIRENGGVIKQLTEMMNGVNAQ
jgi:hypothetical protein